jgi:SAM-dependent methyltransferase
MANADTAANNLMTKSMVLKQNGADPFSLVAYMHRCLAVFILATAAVALAQQRPQPIPDVHFTPTRHAVADAMLQLAQVTAADVVYDLGSGDGRIPIIAAQKYGARGVGIEIDPKLIERARVNAREAGVADRVTFIEGDLFTADLSPATVVTLYLSASINKRLEPKLRRELNPGARIVSHQFLIGDWPPDEKARPDFSDIFLWRIVGQ